MTDKTALANYFDSLLGKVLNQNYRIDSLVALGGMGAVFRGFNLSNNELVAIKVISPHLTANPVFVKRFQREAKVGTVLSHPNIAKVHEFSQTSDGILFMAMEFIDGETLDKYLGRAAPLNVMRCLEILRPLCEALDAAHKRSILHRDLKPANVLISKLQNGKEIIKLVDFGLVKLLQPDSEITAGDNLTGLGEACGTPYYMSPEQVIGQPLGSTADIYGLGIMVYQMLTAKMPVESNNVRQILAVKINQDIPPPSEKFPFIPHVLDPVIQKVLARDPRKRYQTGKELFDDFQKAAFEISLEYSNPTQPVLDHNLLSDIRKDYHHSPQKERTAFSENSLKEENSIEKKLPSTNNSKSPDLPFKAQGNSFPPSAPQFQPTFSDQFQPTVSHQTSHISSSIDDSQPNYYNQPIQPIKLTDSNEKQVKILIIIVGILLGLLIISIALFLMQK